MSTKNFEINKKIPCPPIIDFAYTENNYTKAIYVNLTKKYNCSILKLLQFFYP